MWSCMGLVRRDHGVVSTDRVAPFLMYGIGEKRPWNSMHETRNQSLSLNNIMVSSHQSHTWELEPLYLSMQHHGLFSPTLFMRPWTTLSVYSTSWSLLTNPIHKKRGHSICRYNTMISSHQFYAWDQEPISLSKQHHGLFSPIPNMRTWATLSVYATPWSFLTNSIHETMDHSICLFNIMVSSHKSHTCWWEETMVLYRQIEWSLFSCMGLVRRDHDVV
jgi:hypothetical protein